MGTAAGDGRRRKFRAVRAVTWVTRPGLDTETEVCPVLEHVMAKGWAQAAVAPQVDDGPVTVTVEVVGHDRWRVEQRIRTIGILLGRACGQVTLASVERLPPHTNRQPSVDARQARRAELRAARAARAQNPGHAQVHGQAEQKHEQGSDPVAVD